MNIIILILMCVAAYALNELLSYIDEYQYRKQLRNDIYRFKVKKLINTCKKHCLACGFTREQAEYYAIQYIEEIRKNGLIDNKYQLLKEGA